MTPGLRLKTAGAAALPRIEALLAREGEGTAQLSQLEGPIADGAVLIAERDRRLVAVCAVDVADAGIAAVLVRSAWRRQGIGRRLVEAAERLAVRFGMLQLGVQAPAVAEPFFRACGYEPRPGGDREAGTAGEPRYLHRHFPRRQTRYGARVRALGLGLGVPADYGRRHRLPLRPEASELVVSGRDVFDRPLRLTPAAAKAWQRMHNAAATDSVTLQAASAFRSVDYQAGLIERKLARGQTMREILRVSAAPGYSEHHTGRALDLTTPGSEPLEEEFEGTEAHAWLHRHAAEFGFRMSYPRDNRHGICFEPWHWCFGSR